MGIVISSILLLFLLVIIVWTITTQIESKWDAVKILNGTVNKHSNHEADVLNTINKNRSSINKDTSMKKLENNEVRTSKYSLLISLPIFSNSKQVNIFNRLQINKTYLAGSKEHACE